MSEGLTNIRNPLNNRPDEESRNDPKVTSLPPEAIADDLFDDSVDATDEVPNRRGDEPRQSA